jgi:hypothetical protein
LIEIGSPAQPPKTKSLPAGKKGRLAVKERPILL